MSYFSDLADYLQREWIDSRPHGIEFTFLKIKLEDKRRWTIPSIPHTSTIASTGDAKPIRQNAKRQDAMDWLDRFLAKRQLAEIPAWVPSYLKGDLAEPAPDVDWWKDGDPPGNEFNTPALEGPISHIAHWLEMDERTVKDQNGTRWWIRKIHGRRFKIWFKEQHTYAMANSERIREEQKKTAK